MGFTPMQEKAVMSPVSDILLTAAAGSGKTHVLTGRILNRITNEKADISRMLIITFTNAAATEMPKRFCGIPSISVLVWDFLWFCCCC